MVLASLSIQRCKENDDYIACTDWLLPVAAGGLKERARLRYLRPGELGAAYITCYAYETTTDSTGAMDV